MPLFSKNNIVQALSGNILQNKSSNNNSSGESNKNIGTSNNEVNSTAADTSSTILSPVTRPKLVFQCQQAQGSPTGLISGFTNVKELYEKVAECQDFPMDEYSILATWCKNFIFLKMYRVFQQILYCTLNTHQVDMDSLLNGQLSLEDFIFVHRKGTKKEVEIYKSEDGLGLTITDNGTGYSFIKRIKEDSVILNTNVIQVGDHIEKIDSHNVVGWRHIDVAKHLRSIPVGSTFTMRLVEPLRNGFVNLGPRSSRQKQKFGSEFTNYGIGNETLRFGTNGKLQAKLQAVADDSRTFAISKINNLLENFMGINDADLATQIFEMANGVKDTMEFAESLDDSELGSFEFSDDFVFDVWKIINDTKSPNYLEHKLAY